MQQRKVTMDRQLWRTRFLDVWPKTKKNLTDIAAEMNLNRTTLYKIINNKGNIRMNSIARLRSWVLAIEAELYKTNEGTVWNNSHQSSCAQT